MRWEKRELYELFAQAAKPGTTQPKPTPGAPAGVQSAESLAQSISQAQPAAPARVAAASEIVINRETGLGIFLVMAAFLVTSYYLGLQRGAQQALENRQVETQADVPLVPDAEIDKTLEQRVARSVIPSDAFLLRLAGYTSDSADILRAKADLAYVAEQQLVKEKGFTASLFQKGEAISVCIGPFSRRNDPDLDALARLFRGLSGPPTSRTPKPYESCSIEQAANLGKAVQ